MTLSPRFLPVSALAPLTLVPVQPQDPKLGFGIFDKVHNEAFPPPLLHPFLVLHPPLSLLTFWPSLGAATANRSFLNMEIQEVEIKTEREKKKCPVRFGCSCFLWAGKHSKNKLQTFFFFGNAEVCLFGMKNK